MPNEPYQNTVQFPTRGRGIVGIPAQQTEAEMTWEPFTARLLINGSEIDIERRMIDGFKALEVQGWAETRVSIESGFAFKK